MRIRNKAYKANNGCLISGSFYYRNGPCCSSVLYLILPLTYCFCSIFVIIHIVIQSRASSFYPPFISLSQVWLFGNFSMEI